MPVCHLCGYAVVSRELMSISAAARNYFLDSLLTAEVLAVGDAGYRGTQTGRAARCGPRPDRAIRNRRPHRKRRTETLSNRCKTGAYNGSMNNTSDVYETEDPAPNPRSVAVGSPALHRAAAPRTLLNHLPDVTIRPTPPAAPTVASPTRSTAIDVSTPAVPPPVITDPVAHEAHRTAVHQHRAEAVRLGDDIAELSARIQAATYELLVLIRAIRRAGGVGGVPVMCALAELAHRAQAGRRPREGAGGARIGRPAAVERRDAARADLLLEGARPDARGDPGERTPSARLRAVRPGILR